MIELTAQMDQLIKHQHWMDAIQLAEQNSEILQSSFNASWNTGWAYFKLNQHAEAIPHLQRACSIAPTSHGHVAYWALGVVWMELEKYELAEKCFLKSTGLKSGHLNRTMLAFIYLLTDRTDEAERVHLEGLEEKRTQERLESYADFLGAIGRVEEEAITLLEAQEAPQEGRKYTPD